MQHSRHVPAGRDGLFDLVRAMGDVRFEYDMVAANGDFVWVHSRYTSSASPAALVAVDIVRIEGGKRKAGPTAGTRCAPRSFGRGRTVLGRRR